MDSLKENQPQEAKLHFLDYWRIIRIRKTVILAVFLLVVITATLVTFVLPERFASTARIKIERDQTDIASMTLPTTMGPGYDPYFIQTEFEVIQSEVILGDVVDKLMLDDEHKQKVPLRELWGRRYQGGVKLSRQEAMSFLKGHLNLSPVRNTSLIEIRFSSENPQEAADVANAVADAYLKHRIAKRKELTSGGIEALKARMDEESAHVSEAESNVAWLRISLQIPDALAAGDAPTMTMTAETLRKVEAIRIESKTDLVRQRTLLDKLKNLTPEQLREAIPSAGIPDQQLSDYMSQLNLAQQRQINLARDFGPQNTEVVKVNAQIEDLQTKVNDRVAGILLGLEAKVASMGQSLTNLQDEVKKAMEIDLDQANKSRPYWEAKRHLDELQRFRTVLLMKIASEKTDLDLPKSSMVEIIDNATPGLRPVSPNKPLNISLGVIIGLIVGVGLAFFIEYLDTSVKTIDDVERSLGTAVLGVIPQNVGILMDEGAESPHAEAYRVLRTNLLFSRKDDKLNTVAIVSAGAGEGKSTTVFNLAAVFAQSGQRVLMVDSDLRRPTLHKMLRVTNAIGLTNYLLKQNTLEEVIQTSSLPTLDFMASGKLPSSSLGILSSAQMRDLITELKQHYDFIFFDSPPVMGVSDASILASEVDMTLQVIQYRRYPQPMNIRAKQLIEKVGGNLVGIVLNNINMSQDESYYYYSGYYHDYYTHNEEEPVAAADGGAKPGKDKLDIKQKY
jgi:capsular exopolysaccharide synthesis family protein